MFLIIIEQFYSCIHAFKTLEWRIKNHLQIDNVGWVQFELQIIASIKRRIMIYFYLQPIWLQFQSVKSHLKSLYISLNPHCSFDTLHVMMLFMVGFMCVLTTVDATNFRCKRFSVFGIQFSSYAQRILDLIYTFGISRKHVTYSMFSVQIIIAFLNTYNTLKGFEIWQNINQNPAHYIEDQRYLCARVVFILNIFTNNVFKLFQ